MGKDQLRTYLTGNFTRIEGWVNAPVFAPLEAVFENFDANEVLGGACEIGVHHGRFFIALASLVSDRGKCLAIDVFDLQRFNIDSSGNGSRKIFEKNLVASLGEDVPVGIVEADSLTFSGETISRLRDEFGTFSLFSVDGGHTSHHAASDMIMAEALVSPGGIVILDDFFHPDWPGVTEGYYRYANRAGSVLAPFCLAGGKLFLTLLSFHDEYVHQVLSFVAAHRPNGYTKVVDIGGFRCVSYKTIGHEPILI